MLLAGCAGGEGAGRGSGKGDIVIGVGWPLATRNEGLAEGVAMAAEEINDAGGVLGRRLRIESIDDGGLPAEGLDAARRFADDPDIAAVIGHRGSSVSIPASDVYEQAGIVMLSPGSTSPKLTERDQQYIFRTIPSDARIGARMAQFAASKGYQRVAILYSDDEYGRGLANAFEDSGKEAGIETIDRLTGYADRTDLARIVRGWKALACDAVFIADVMPAAGHTVADLRQAGAAFPILGGDGLDSAELRELAGPAAEGAVVASIFNPEDSRPAVKDFMQRYEARYGEQPGKWAAQGYDALDLLADAIAKAGSAKPAAIAEALRSMSGWEGVTGSHTFDASGDVTDMPVVLKTMAGGRFQYSGGQEG
nr:ABC transporter substrate-binding protein [Cohnella lubricantis]